MYYAGQVEDGQVGVGDIARPCDNSCAGPTTKSQCTETYFTFAC